MLVNTQTPTNGQFIRCGHTGLLSFVLLMWVSLYVTPMHLTLAAILDCVRRHVPAPC